MFDYVLIWGSLALAATGVPDTSPRLNSSDHVLFHDKQSCEDAVRQMHERWPGSADGFCKKLGVDVPEHPGRKPKARPE